MADRGETGKDGVLIVAGEEFPFTDLNLDDDIDISESENNQSMFRDLVQTGVSVSGDFEFDGSRSELRDAVRNDDGTAKEDLRILIRGSEQGYRIEGVIVTSISRSYPGDDRTSTSADFEGERMRRI
jgi:hypothetical protein